MSPHDSEEPAAGATEEGRPPAVRAATLAWIVLGALAGLALFQVAKESLFPGLSLWASHAITIGFGGILAGVGGWILLRLHARLRQQREQEMVRRLAAEAESLSDRAALQDRARLKATLDAAVDAILTIDERGIVDSANPAAEHIFGYRADEMIGRNVSMLMPAPYRDEHDGYIQRYLRSGEPRIIGIGRELVARRKDGWIFPVDLAVNEARVGDTRIFTGLIKDISERKATEEALRMERDFAERLIATAPVIVLVLDLQGRILQFNPYMERLCGYELEEVEGKDWFTTFLPESDRARIQGVFRDALGGNRVAGNINPIVTKDGQLREVVWHDAPLEDADGNLAGILAVGQDITERKRLEEDFMQAQKMEAVGRLAGGIAHDFNNLLMGVLGCCRLAARSLDPGSQAGGYIEEISAAAERGGALARQLLSFSRKRPAEVKPISLNQVIRASETMVRQLVGEDIRLRVDLDPSGCPVLADPGRMEQVLMNLVVNARDAMPQGGELVIRTRDLALSSGRDNPAPEVLLSIRDTGVGMDKETEARVFEPFFTTKEPGRGTGLGLSTVYGIIQQLGGRVAVRSRPGQGATFEIHIPRNQEAPKAAEPGGPPKAPEASGGTILVVEDERLVRLSVVHYLREAGFQVLEAGDADEAVRACNEHEGPIHLLLSDMILPGRSGRELAQDCAARRPGTRVLFMSAHPATLLEKEGRLEPGIPILEKPFTEEELLARVRGLLHSPA